MVRNLVTKTRGFLQPWWGERPLSRSTTPMPLIKAERKPRSQQASSRGKHLLNSRKVWFLARMHFSCSESNLRFNFRVAKAQRAEKWNLSPERERGGERTTRRRSCFWSASKTDRQSSEFSSADHRSRSCPNTNFSQSPSTVVPKRNLLFTALTKKICYFYAIENGTVSRGKMGAKDADEVAECLAMRRDTKTNVIQT